MVKIAFVQEELRTRFGIMILSAVLKSGGHKCDVFIQDQCENIIEEIIRYGPDIIAFSTMTPGISFALDSAKKLRDKSNALIVMGGPHPTFYPEVIEENCLDVICIGEGEYALLELANSIDTGNDITNIKNLWVKKGSKVFKNELRDLVDLDQLPSYDWDLYYSKYPELRDAPTKLIFVTRGCPFNCTYCFNHNLKEMYRGKGQFVRYMSVEKVLLEINTIKKQYEMKWLQIMGDTINADRNWFYDFLNRYKQTFDIPFLCNVRIDLIDEETVKLMKDAGCERVDYGIEHGDEWIRKNVLKRNMSDQIIIENGKLFNKFGIRVQTTNLIGVPYETVDTAFKTIDINRHVKPELAKCTILQPYPGTKINEYALQNGFLEKDYEYSKFGTSFTIDFDGSTDFIPLKLEQHDEIVNLFYFFNFLVQHKWVEPLVKYLIRIPPNRFFKAVYIFPMIRQEVKYTNSKRKKVKAAGRFFRLLITGR